MRNMANKGLAAEQTIEMANRFYYERGIGIFVKQHTHWQPVFNRGSQAMQAFPKEKAVVDYIGLGHCKALAFDVKECSGPRWALNELQPHQREFLERWQAQSKDSLAFILICNNVTGTWHLLSFRHYLEIEAAALRGEHNKSLSQAEIVELPLCESSEGCVCDWLRVAMEVAR